MTNTAERVSSVSLLGMHIWYIQTLYAGTFEGAGAIKPHDAVAANIMIAGNLRKCCRIDMASN